jgi:hypothetical protein
MRTVYHPTLPDVTHEVEDAQVDDWKAAGWRLTKPRLSADDTTETPAAATAADQGQHSDEGENHG